MCTGDFNLAGKFSLIQLSSCALFPCNTAVSLIPLLSSTFKHIPEGSQPEAGSHSSEQRYTSGMWAPCGGKWGTAAQVESQHLTRLRGNEGNFIQDFLHRAVHTKDCKTGEINLGNWNKTTKWISQLFSCSPGMQPEIKSALDRHQLTYAGDSHSCCAQALFIVGGHRK